MIYCLPINNAAFTKSMQKKAFKKKGMSYIKHCNTLLKAFVKMTFFFYFIRKLESKLK